MPTRLRLAALAPLAVALCVLAPDAHAFQQFDSPVGPSIGASATKASPHEVLRRTEQAFAKGGDLSPLLRRLALALPQLSGAEKKRAQSLLARPTDGSADPQQNGWSVPEAKESPICSAHFCVHWVASGADAPPPADSNHDGVPNWVDLTAATAEHVYDVENGAMGWRTPRSDGSEGGAPAGH